MVWYDTDADCWRTIFGTHAGKTRVVNKTNVRLQNSTATESFTGRMGSTKRARRKQLQETANQTRPCRFLDSEKLLHRTLPSSCCSRGRVFPSPAQMCSHLSYIWHATHYLLLRSCSAISTTLMFVFAGDCYRRTARCALDVHDVLSRAL